MLIVFPLGLLATAVAFDIVGLVGRETEWFRISFWMIAAGIIGGLVAAVFGLVDLLAIPGGTRAQRIGLLHGGGNVLVVLLFIVSWFLRRPAPQNPPSGAFVFSFVAVALALVTGWLGGELVYRLGIGVHQDANASAPSSLSRRPTDEEPRQGPRLAA